MGRNTGSRNVLSRLKTRVMKTPKGFVTSKTIARKNSICNQPFNVIGTPYHSPYSTGGAARVHVYVASAGQSPTKPATGRQINSTAELRASKISELLGSQQRVKQINHCQGANCEH